MFKHIYEWMSAKSGSRHENFIKGKRYLEQYRPDITCSSFEEMIERAEELFTDARNNLNLEEAEKCFMEAMKESKDVTRYDDVATALYQLGIVKMRQGKYEEAFGKFNEAVEMSRNSVKSSKHRFISDCFYYMGMNAIFHKQFAQAEEYLLEALDIAKIHGTGKDASAVQELLTFCTRGMRGDDD